MSAQRAAIKAVKLPIIATTASASGVKSVNTLANKKTQAATMVAACINAETGIGPSIASDNQVNKGNCADFPITPEKMQSDAAVCHEYISGKCRSSLRLKFCVFAQMIIFFKMHEFRLFFPLLAIGFATQLAYFLLGNKNKRWKELINYALLVAVFYSLYGERVL